MENKKLSVEERLAIIMGDGKPNKQTQKEEVKEEPTKEMPKTREEEVQAPTIKKSEQLVVEAPKQESVSTKKENIPKKPKEPRQLQVPKENRTGFLYMLSCIAAIVFGCCLFIGVIFIMSGDVPAKDIYYLFVFSSPGIAGVYHFYFLYKERKKQQRIYQHGLRQWDAYKKANDEWLDYEAERKRNERVTAIIAMREAVMASFDVEYGTEGVVYTEVAGIYYRPKNSLLVVSSLTTGGKVELRREPNNAYDPYAVKVMSNGKHIGYIPSEQSEDVFNFIGKRNQRYISVVESNDSFYDESWDEYEYRKYASFHIVLRLYPFKYE